MDAEKLAKEWLDRKVKHPENTTRELANFLTRAIEEEAQNKKWDEHISNITIENLRGQRDTLRAQLADLREGVNSALRIIDDGDAIGAQSWEGAVDAIRACLEAALARVEAGKQSMPRPKIVCLCGSTRFMEQFFNSGWDETMKGNIVLSVGVNLKMETPDGGHIGEAMGPEIKEMLDELHKRKIDLADEALVLNVGGYIGESTASEIAYAIDHGKLVRYLEPPATDTP